MKTRISEFLLVGTILAFFAGCSVDPNYSAEKIDDVNQEITLFQNGLSIPIIRNTVALKAGELIESIENTTIRELLKVMDDKYEINLKGYESFDSVIGELNFDESLKINPIQFETNFSTEFGEFDSEKIKNDPIDFFGEVMLPDFSDVSNISIDSFNQRISADAGLLEKNFDVIISMDPFKRKQVIFSEQDIKHAGQLSPMEEVQLPLSPVIFNVSAESIPAFTTPDNIKEIKSVTLSKNARVSVKLSVFNCIFTAGTVTPDIDVNLSDLLVFEDGSGILDLSTMVLDATNGYSTSKEFVVTGVNMDKFGTSKSLSTSGTLMVAGARSTKAKCISTSGDMGIDISIEFLDFGIESVNCELKEVSSSLSKEVEIPINDITVPKEVKTVDYVSFSNTSNVTMKLSATNLSKIPGLNLKARILKVTFPEEMVVSGSNIVNNVLTLADINLSEEQTYMIKVSKVNFPAPKNGKISFSPKIGITADCSATGTVNTADIKKLTSDVSLSAEFSGELTVEDFQATINKCEREIPKTQGSIFISVPDEAASYGTLTITPAGTPALSLKMSVPDITGISLSAGDGIKVQLPEFIVLGTVDSALGYDKENNTLTIKKIENRTYTIPIEKIVAQPVKTDSGYIISGEYSVQGTISIAEGIVTKSILDNISEAKLGYSANIPAIKVAKIAMESLSFGVNESFDVDILDSKDIPDMLVQVGEIKLEGVEAGLGVELQGLPSIGSKAKYIIDVEAELPSFISPSTITINGELSNGKFNCQPVTIEGFNLEDFDLPGMKAAGECLKGKVTVKGRIYAQNPEVDLSTISGTVSGKVNVSIKNSDNKIEVKSIAAKIDYQIDSTISVDMTGINEKLKDVHFDMPDLTAIVGIRSNLAIPISGSAKVVPVKNEKELTELALETALTFPYCVPPAQSDTVTNTLNFNFNDILNSKCDSIRIHIGLNSDKTRDCYIEPQRDYSLSLGYDVNMPLQPKENFQVELVDTLDLGGALAGVEKFIAYSPVGITGEIENTFPLGLTVNVSFLNFDKEKGIYRTIGLKDVSTDILKPNSESQIEIVTRPEKPGDKLPEITHLRFSLMFTSDGKPISPDSNLQINNLTLQLPEGVTIDTADI